MFQKKKLVRQRTVDGIDCITSRTNDYLRATRFFVE
jgi:hypothetical protein